MKIHYDMGKSWEFFSNPGHTCGPLAAPGRAEQFGAGCSLRVLCGGVCLEGGMANDLRF